jgi:hypothetical protein
VGSLHPSLIQVLIRGKKKFFLCHLIKKMSKKDYQYEYIKRQNRQFAL